MGYFLLAYATDGYQEFVLPELVDVNYRISLEGQKFGLQKDLAVLLENVDERWSFVESEKYQLQMYEGTNAFGCPLEDGMVVRVKTNAGIKIMLLCFYSEYSFPVYDKYFIGGLSQISIGKEDSNSIAYGATRFVSRNHAVLYGSGNGWTLQDNSSNGTYLNGHRIRERQSLKFGDTITLVGLSIIFLGDYLAISALSGNYQVMDEKLIRFYPRKNLVLPEYIKNEKKKEYFKRSPRTMEKLFTEVIEIEAPPMLNKTSKRPLFLTIGPSLTMAIPMMLGCIMAIASASKNGGGGAYMFTGIVTAVSSAIIGAVWAMVNLKYSGKEEADQEETRYNTYGQYLIGITEKIKQKYNLNREAMFRMYLSGEECCAFSKNDVRLWNHNEHQKDFLAVRLGTGTIPFQAEIKIPKEKFSLIRDDLAEKPRTIRDTYQYLYSVPVCMDIRNKGVIGMIGGKGKHGAYSVVYNMVAQIAANNSYTDVKLVFLFNGHRSGMDRWEFAKWLPHVWMEDKKTRLIASDKAEVGDIMYELSTMLRMRTEEQQNKKGAPLPHYVIIVDDPTLIEGELLEHDLYRPKPEYGITTILLAEKYGDLPNSCETIIQNDGSSCQFFHVFDEKARSKDLVLETVRKESLEHLARKLCDIEVNEVVGNGEIPNSLDFFDMYGVKTLEQLNVIDRWKKNRNYENMRVPIGQRSGGAPCYLDIHEKYHGPHGLVAGTTGSGKSETLQTYILSLAVNFSPDDIAFFIIDFKGGGMANLFSDLPHLAGQISNLSGNQVRRAMISIKSENQRRQRVFAEHDVNNINSYTRLFKNHEAKDPVPHLFIIIDEFAELKREEPEFMKELISVAQVGRSLGVHLILATQKPSGTVDENIWSNSKFRLCLRVQDKQDSNDMLHKPDASYITQAGRGFLQVGNDEIYEQFQSGYSGAEYCDHPSMARGSCAEMLSLTGKREGVAVRRKTDGKRRVISQLDAVIMYLNKLAQQYHYNQGMVLWLPVLPECLFLHQLEGFSESVWSDGKWMQHDREWELEVPIGLYDDPVNQAQLPMKLNFMEGGHHAICGTVATGKSTFLQTLLYALIMTHSPNEINFYVLDYSSRLLLSFEKAPHCGGVIIDTDVDKVQKFFYMIQQILEERKVLFKGGNYRQYVQQKKSKEEAIPAVLIVIDNYSNFREKTDGAYDDMMNRLAREGVGYGIFIVATSAGFGSSEIPNRIADNIRTVISLEMGDKFKYAEVLRTTRVEIVPELDVKGRGLAYVHGNILEFQTALSMEEKDAYLVSERIEQLGVKMEEQRKGRRARKIPVIPEHPVFSEFVKLEEYEKGLQNRRMLPFGYRSEDASVYGIDLFHTYCYLIQGQNRSGRKNVMKMMMYAASKKENVHAVVIEIRTSEMNLTAEQLGMEYISTEEEVYRFFKETIPTFKERNQKKKQLETQELESEEIAEKMSEEQQYFVFIPNMADFLNSVYHPGEGVGSVSPYLENITEKGSNHGFFFFGIMEPGQVTALSSYKMFHNMASYKTGMHLGGNISGQRFFQFHNISYQEQSKNMRPGKAYVQSAEDSNMAEVVVLPLVKGGFS